MFDELLPTGLTKAARTLGVEPLEIVRLMVISDTVTPAFQVSAEHLAKLGTLGGIQHGWWTDVDLPEDGSQARARVRATLTLLLQRGAQGPVRMDNLWRGLPIADQELIEEALNALADEEFLVVTNAPMGVVVSVQDGANDTIQGLADATIANESLEALYAGQ